jgi:hypothetical protein
MFALRRTRRGGSVACRAVVPRVRDEGGSGLEVGNTSIHHPSVSKVEQMEAELRKLSQTELCQIREWLDDMIEDQLPFTPEFERSIQQAERDMAEGKSARVA